MKTSLTLGVLAVVALLVPGIAYWKLHENSEPDAPSSSTGAPAPQTSTPPPAPAPPASAAPPPAPAPQASAPRPAPAPQASAPPPTPAPRPAASSTPPVIAQSNQPAASPGTPPSPPATAERAQATGAPSVTPAPPATLPADGQMSGADRRQVQEILQRLNYYQGPIDGKFGPATRAAIRLFQDSIKVNSTGYLTAAEATRLVGTVAR
jgi:hypothetical protein